MLQDEEFDWEGDRPLETPMEDLVIYEMHVRGEKHSTSTSTSGHRTAAAPLAAAAVAASPNSATQTGSSRALEWGMAVSMPNRQVCQFTAAATAAVSVPVRHFRLVMIRLDLLCCALQASLLTLAVLCKRQAHTWA
jgi:hypothetical protein